MGNRHLALLARLAAVAIVAPSAMMAGCAGSRPSSHDAVTATSTVAPQPNLASCDTVHVSYEPKLQDQHIRCMLSVDNLTLEVSSDPAWSFNLLDRGAAVQQFSERTEEAGESGTVPLLQDIDGSGRPVLLVVTERGGTGGEPMAVWRLAGTPPRFVRAGEMFGFRQFYQSSEGFFGNYAHSSAASGTVTLYRWVDDKLATVAVLDTQSAKAPTDGDARSWVHNGGVLCALSEDDYPPGAAAQRTAALNAAGIDPATASERFCTQPWVATIYR